MGVFIRRAKISDCKTIGFIHVESCKAAYKGIIPDSVLNSVSAKRMADYYYRVLVKKAQDVVLIFKDDKPAGYMSLIEYRNKNNNYSAMQVYRIYLLPSYRHQGLGTELINWGIKEAKDKGHSKLFLWVIKENLSARKFYEKLGLRYDGTARRINNGKMLTIYRYVMHLDGNKFR